MCPARHTPNVKKLADLKSKTLAIMHGSSFTGDCASKRVPAGLHNDSKSLLPSSVNWTNCPIHLLSLRRRMCCNHPPNTVRLLWEPRQSQPSTITANGDVLSEFSRLEIMCPSVRPIEREMREPRTGLQN